MSRWTERVLGGTALVGGVALVLGCAGVQKVREAAARAERANFLKATALAYHDYSSEKNKPPTQAADLQPYLADFPQAAQALNSGELVVVWGVDLGQLSKANQTASVVLVYEAAVPTSGGQVAMADGSVRQMTAAEFAAAPKAPTKAPK
jgi:hypothetical protein